MVPPLTKGKVTGDTPINLKLYHQSRQFLPCLACVYSFTASKATRIATYLSSIHDHVEIFNLVFIQCRTLSIIINDFMF